MRLALAAIVLIASLATACTVAPERSELAVQLPDQFYGLDAAPAPATWWRVFSDVRLDQLIGEALTNNPDVAAIAAAMRAAQASASAAGAPLIPAVNFELSRREGNNNSGFASRDDNAQLTAAYEIDFWGRIRAGRAAAVLQAQASEQQLFAAQVSLSANVATTWFQLGTAAAQMDLIALERQRYERTLHLVELRFRNGQAQISDVLRQRQLLESTRALQAQTQAQLGVLRNALEGLLGKAAGSAEYSGALPATELNIGTEGIPAEVVHRRPDVMQSWLLVRAADENVAAAIANRFPRLNLNFSYASQTRGSSALFEDWIDTLIGSLTLPLIDGGARRAEVRRTDAVLDQRIAEYRSAVLTAFREIKDAQLRIENFNLHLQSLEEQARISSRVLERIERQLRQGGVQYVDLLDAQISDSSLRREVLSARQQLIEQKIRLLRALAGPLPPQAQQLS